jgi:hypothetical protein
METKYKMFSELKTIYNDLEYRTAKAAKEFAIDVLKQNGGNITLGYVYCFFIRFNRKLGNDMNIRVKSVHLEKDDFGVEAITFDFDGDTEGVSNYTSWRDYIALAEALRDFDIISNAGK